MKKRKHEQIRATLSAWATALGKESRTLARALTRNGVTVTKGKLYSARQVFEGGGRAELSLDQARARLADVKASVLIKGAALASGEVVDLVWVASEADKAFNGFSLALQESRGQFAFYLGGDNQAQRDKATEILKERDDLVNQMIRNARMRLLATLQTGQPESDGRTVISEFKEHARRVAERMSPGARAEFAAALRSEEAAQAPTAEP